MFRFLCNFWGITYKERFISTGSAPYVMKKKLSIRREGKNIDSLDAYVKEGSLRNKSHLIEFAVNKLLKEKKTHEENSAAI